MAYTVKKLSEISGLSIRTLHFYDEIGLFKPAYHGENGYRYYEEKQLLILQQILFFKELGLELKKIQKLLGRSDFDTLAALYSHREILQKDLERIKSLLVTIDKTIDHLRGKKKMKDEEIYFGFSKEKQKEYERQILERYGDKVKPQFEECRKNVGNWTKEDWEKSQKACRAICEDLALLMKKGLKVSSKEVQEVISRHYAWLKQFWTPDRESYAGHGQFILETELKEAYKVYHPEMPAFIAAAISIYAKEKL